MSDFKLIGNIYEHIDKSYVISTTGNLSYGFDECVIVKKGAWTWLTEFKTERVNSVDDTQYNYLGSCNLLLIINNHVEER